MIKNQQNSVTKKDPHLGKKKYYYFYSFSLIRWWWNEVMKLFFYDSKCLITDSQGIDNEVNNIKKYGVQGGTFW
jgi:hypothetical protein